MKLFLITLLVLFPAMSFAQDQLLSDEVLEAAPQDMLEAPAADSGAQVEAPAQADEIKLDDGLAAPAATKDVVVQIKKGDAPLTPLSAGYTPFDGIDFDTLNNDISSMMFSSEQVDLLYSRIRKFKLSGGNIESVIATSEDGALSEEEQKYTFVTFYLASILYPSDGDWSIWLNNEKIRKESATELATVEIKKVSENHIVLEYKTDPQQFTVNAPTYKNILNRVTPEDSLGDEQPWDFISKDKNIKVASSVAVVQFKLRMGQTFSLYDMEVKEGQYTPAGAAPVATDASADQPIDEMLDAGQDVDMLDSKPQSIDSLKKDKSEDVPAAKKDEAPNSAPKPVDPAEKKAKEGEEKARANAEAEKK